METAGKLVDNDELRDALKENGIGRPSTRAAIIETLFKRNYIRKERKNLYPTATGTELIGIIQEELLKSAELTGLWEKKLRQIEKGTYKASLFIEELKQMVQQVVQNVLADQRGRTITIDKEKAVAHTTAATKKPLLLCPICHRGTILRGKTAYGCSEYKNGCHFRLDYTTYGKDLSDEELYKVIQSMTK